MWLFYALLAALMWGVGQIFVKKGLNEISSLFNNILSSSIGFIIFIPFALINGVHFEKILSIAPFACIVSALFFSYYYVIGRGQLALTGTVVGTYPIITVILSLIFLNESPSIFQKLAIGVIILGTVLVAFPNKVQKTKIGSWLLFALVAVFMIGTADFMIKLLINKSDLYTYLFTYGICSMLVTILLSLLDKKGRKLPQFNLKQYLPTFIGDGLIEVGFFIFHLALKDGYISLVSPISGIYVGITAVLAWLILKEKISKVQFAGIALAAIGVILVGIN